MKSLIVRRNSLIWLLCQYIIGKEKGVCDYLLYTIPLMWGVYAAAVKVTKGNVE